MKLIKYCDSKYHYSKSKRLQIGTLEYFRNHDNNFIADPGECIGGPYSMKPQNAHANISQGFINQIGGGIIAKGAAFDTPIIKIEPGASLNINKKFKFPNIYIFCCSHEKCASIETAKGLVHRIA